MDIVDCSNGKGCTHGEGGNVAFACAKCTEQALGATYTKYPKGYSMCFEHASKNLFCLLSCIELMFACVGPAEQACYYKNINGARNWSSPFKPQGAYEERGYTSTAATQACSSVGVRVVQGVGGANGTGVYAYVG